MKTGSVLSEMYERGVELTWLLWAKLDSLGVEAANLGRTLWVRLEADFYLILFQKWKLKLKLWPVAWGLLYILVCVCLCILQFLKEWAVKTYVAMLCGQLAFVFALQTKSLSEHVHSTIGRMHLVWVVRRMLCRLVKQSVEITEYELHS